MTPHRTVYSTSIPLIVGRIGLLLVLLALWQAGYMTFGLSTVAPPLQTFVRLSQLVLNGELWQHIAATLRVSMLGLVLGWLAGMVVALALSCSARLASALEPYILASIGVPKFALAPLLILWFGIGDGPKVVVVTLMVFYVVFITALAGARALDPRLVAMARIVGASRWGVTREVVLHSVVPYLLTGLKVGIPRAISAAVVGEFLVADHGLGFYIEHSRQTADTVGVFTGLLVVTALVLSSDVLLQRLQRRVLAWQPLDQARVAN